MKKYKGTKEDWYVYNKKEILNGSETFGIETAAGSVIVWRDDLDSDFSPEEELAHANVTAAAPELLKACMEFVRKCDCGEARSKRSYKQMSEAISKALD